MIRALPILEQDSRLIGYLTAAARVQQRPQQQNAAWLAQDDSRIKPQYVRVLVVSVDKSPEAEILSTLPGRILVKSAVPRRATTPAEGNTDLYA
jgi:hypothetical protein